MAEPKPPGPLLPQQLRRIDGERMPRRNPCGDKPDQRHRRDHTGQHERIARRGLVNDLRKKPANHRLCGEAFLEIVHGGLVCVGMVLPVQALRHK